MFVLNRTHARWAFKDLLGQANHFLITILVGLNGVRTNQVSFDEEFRTSWNPQDPKRSAERSRVFALDLALVRAVDALDTYFMSSVRKPKAIFDTNFVAAMDGTGRSVAKRLDVFDNFLPSLTAGHKALLEVAIEWRNGRVHSLAETRIDKAKRQQIAQDEDQFRVHNSGLEVKEFLAHFDAGVAPTFKEAASIIRLCHTAVEHYDANLLAQLPLARYLCDAVTMILAEGGTELRSPIARIWDSPKREAKALRLLRLAGVSEATEVQGRQVPDSFVDRFVALAPEKVEEFLQNA